MSMDRYHRDIMRKQAVYITENLQITEKFMAELWQTGVLTEANMEELSASLLLVLYPIAMICYWVQGEETQQIVLDIGVV